MNQLDKKLHDIRKPLNTISMQAELIKMIEESKDADQNIIDAATKIVKSAKECSAQLNDLFTSVQDLTLPQSNELK